MFVISPAPKRNCLSPVAHRRRHKSLLQIEPVLHHSDTKLSIRMEFVLYSAVIKILSILIAHLFQKESQDFCNPINVTKVHKEQN